MTATLPPLPPFTTIDHDIPDPSVREWVGQCVNLCQPDDAVVLHGGPQERQKLIEQAVTQGVLIRLNQQKLPGCYLHRSSANDVARTEHLTFICTPTEHDAGPTNNWMEPRSAYAKLGDLFTGCMRGRTMYVIPFVMGPVGCPLARVGIQVTDSIYVAISMGIMTRMGSVAFATLAQTGGSFTRCLHALGDVNPDRRYICHFPQDNTVWSFGSGYGGNALLGKKCLALRLASYMGRHEVGPIGAWMAEHMLISGVTSPTGQRVYVAGAFPSACGKTNFAMLIPPKKYLDAGWRVTTVGDDIAWMWVNPPDGKLRAVNPEAGYFGVLPGTSQDSNPNAMATMSRDTIYTNVAMTADGDVWWEGRTDSAPATLTDWEGKPWTPDCGRKAAHPNSRFTAPMSNNPSLDPHADDPAGVPVSAIIFGGRRSKNVPLVFQAFNWVHGAYLGATLASETTAAATGAVGQLRRDPMAMLPFCGYHLAEYFKHWLRMRKRLTDCPRIFHVNWFRKDEAGKFLWPGFGENMRVLKWIFDRCTGGANATEGLLGWMPRVTEFELDGSGVSHAQFEAAQHVSVEEAKNEVLTAEELFLKLAGEMPKEFIFQRELLISRL